MDSVFSDEDLIQLSFLRDEEVDSLVLTGDLDEECRLDSPLEKAVAFKFPEIILHVNPGPYYPVLLGSEGFFTIENIQMSRVPCDALRARLLHIYDEALQTNTLSMWEARDDLDPYGLFERAMVVSQLVEATRDSLVQYRAAAEENLVKFHSFLPDQDRVEEAVIQQKRLGEIRSSSEMARELVGSPADVIKHIPSDMRVLHVEEVIRNKLASRFYEARDAMYQKLYKMGRHSLSQYMPPGVAVRRAEDAVDHVIKPRLTFHGTRRANVPFIVQHGFLLPGTPVPSGSKNKKIAPQIHRVQQGATYGQGIYSSPNAEFSLDYSGWYCDPTPPGEYFGLKLIVCATLMGRFARVDRSHELRETTEPLPNRDSHMANRDLEYIVFNAAHILPVYVIHLDWGVDNKLHYIPMNRWEWFAPSHNGPRAGSDLNPTMAGASGMAPGDRQRAKEAVMARALKWFPYGFGPKTKGNFVVEDVGEVSEDEEDYGEYQSMRLDEGTTAAGGTDYWSWVKAASLENGDQDSPHAAAALDEYSQDRLAKTYAPTTVKWDHILLPGETREEDPGIPEWFAAEMS